MAVFAYTARNNAGQLIEAKLDADSEDAAARQLRESGVTPIRIARAGFEASADVKLALPWSRARVSQEDLIIFCRHMHRLSKAGIPIIRAMTSLVESTRSPELARVLRGVSDSMKSGRELSESLRPHAHVFSNLFVSVIQVGENTGMLEEAFLQMGIYLERDRETRKQIKSAMRYPLMVLGAIGGAIVLINLFVIPSFARTFQSFGSELPWATRVLIALSDFMVAYWPIMILAAGGVVFSVKRYLATKPGRKDWDRIKLRIPAVGAVIERATLARYARSFAMTFNAGVPVIEVLRVAARAVDNAFVSERIMDMRASLERGETLTRAAHACGMFDSLMLQMMAVGEESGSVGEMHQEIAEAYEAEVDYDLKRLSDMIEPIMIVAVGGIVLILALAIYLPMWDMAGAVRGGG